ncbi:MAG: UDP-3-O-acyl-N-acetylglucosamine deacetylase [Campylobacterales bacterium]
MRQRTIGRRVEAVGIGLHKGVPVKMVLEPMEAGSGISFYRADKGVSIDATPENVVDTTMATVLGRDGVTISTIEHLLSAVAGHGIDNLRIIVDNDEVPIMDGSSVGYCMLLAEAGLAENDAGKKVMIINKEVEVSDGKKFVRLTPSLTPEYRFEIYFDHPAIKSQRFTFKLTRKNYIEQIARARTFGFVQEVQYLRSKGLALGGSLENAIVLDDRKILNPEGLRFEDEFVRHKILDAIGDMSLLGMPFIGRYEAFAGSHKLNHELTKAVLADPDAFEIVEVTTGNAKELEPIFA